MKIFTFLSAFTLTAASIVLAAPFNAEYTTLDLLYNETLPGSTSQAILQFCKDLLANATDATSSQVKETVGKILYLYENNHQDLASAITASDTKRTTGKVDLLFAKAMNELNQSLFKLKIQHQIAGIQNPSIALEEHIPKVIAHCLLTKEGTINFGIAPSLQKTLVPTISLAYQKDIARFLNLLITISQDEKLTESWETIFQEVTKPISPTFAANDLIRATLGLSANTVVTDLHAKEVFLYFFMGHARQGAVGDCFEEWWKIFVKDGLWHTLAKDGIQLLQYGALIRNIHGEPQKFSFDYSMADDNLQHRVTLDKKGTIRAGMSLFDAPGIRAAAKQMGLENPNAILNDLLLILLKDNPNGTFSVETIITTIAQAVFNAGLNEKKDVQTLSKLGFFGFSAENECPPLDMYGSCLASFAEALKTDYVHGTALYAVEYTIDSQWHLGTTPWQSPAIDRAKKLFSDTLNAQMVFYYNEKIPLAQPAADGSSTAGGFELHRVTGELVANPQDFQKLILDVLGMIKTLNQQLLKDSLINYLSFNSMQAAVDRVIHYISKDQNFLKMVLWNYNADNKHYIAPLAHWQDLAHTPWLDQTGDDPNAVFEIATGMMLPKATAIVPKNAHELASSFLKFARNLEQSQHYLENSQFNGRVPVWNPIHAYTGRLDDTGMIDAVQSMLSVEDWLSKRLFQTGYTVSKGTLSRSVANALIETLAKALPQSDGQNFLSKSMGAYQDSICVRDFARKLIKILTEINPKYSGAKMHAKLAYILTETLLATLPSDMLATLTTSAVQAFDTNWYDSENSQGMWMVPKDIHFCFFFDPVTEDILFGIVDEDGTDLRLIDQNQWVNGQEWDFVPAILVDSIH
jgi:hypothetical protein